MTTDHTFIFVAGLHRSGTSLLHQLIRDHPLVSGFSNTGVPQDEGQHLQTVYPPARAYGGPGRFVFQAAAHMNEDHPLATDENARELFRQWSRHYDVSRRYLVEKSPPNIIRTRFLQTLFPDSCFVVILRHPAAVSLSTRKWSKTSLESLLDHCLLAYERFEDDMPALRRVHVLRYEDLVRDPQKQVDGVLRFIGLPSQAVSRPVMAGVNDRYFAMWETERAYVRQAIGGSAYASMETRTNRFGYSLDDCSYVGLLASAPAIRPGDQ